MDRRPTPRPLSSGRKRPNYTLRRIMALLVVVVAVVLVSRLISGIVSLFGSGNGGTPVAQGSTHASPSSSPTPVAPPACAYGNRSAAFRGYDEWQLTLLDTKYRVPRTYVPPGLKPISGAGFKSAWLVRAELIDDLTALRKAALAAGEPIGIVAAYRSYDEQASL